MDRNDIQVSKPDYIVFVPEGKPDVRGDTYNDHFQVFDKPDGRLFAAWTQASREGNKDQHIAFSKSTDLGRTWIRPMVLAGSECCRHPRPIASWQQPMVSASGRIYVLYNQQMEGKYGLNQQHCGLLFGRYSDDDGETWSEPEDIPMPRMQYDHPDPTMPPDWVNWQRPLRLGKGGRYLVAMTRHVNINGRRRHATQFMQFDNTGPAPAKRHPAPAAWRGLVFSPAFSWRTLFGAPTAAPRVHSLRDSRGAPILSPHTLTLPKTLAQINVDRNDKYYIFVNTICFGMFRRIRLTKKGSSYDWRPHPAGTAGSWFDTR